MWKKLFNSKKIQHSLVLSCILDSVNLPVDQDILSYLKKKKIIMLFAMVSKLTALQSSKNNVESSIVN